MHKVESRKSMADWAYRHEKAAKTDGKAERKTERRGRKGREEGVATLLHSSLGKRAPGGEQRGRPIATEADMRFSFRAILVVSLVRKLFH